MKVVEYKPIEKPLRPYMVDNKPVLWWLPPVKRVERQASTDSKSNQYELVILAKFPPTGDE